MLPPIIKKSFWLEDLCGLASLEKVTTFLSIFDSEYPCIGLGFFFLKINELY
jgi:hypothetical protein